MKSLMGVKGSIVRTGLTFVCVVVDVRSPRAHGAKPEIKVTPLSGHGERWVSDWSHTPDNYGLVEGPKDDNNEDR